MIEIQHVERLLNDAEIAGLIRLSVSWVRQQRFLRRHGRPHALTVDPVLIGTAPRYRRDEVMAWIEGLPQVGREHAEPEIIPNHSDRAEIEEARTRLQAARCGLVLPTREDARRARDQRMD